METYLSFPIISSEISMPGIQLLLIENENKKLILGLTYYGVDSDILNWFHTLTLYAPIPQNDQTHSNNSSASDNKLFEWIWPFCGVGAKRINLVFPLLNLNK